MYILKPFFYDEFQCIGGGVQLYMLWRMVDYSRRRNCQKV